LKTLCLNSHAKLNLFLKVLYKRKDNYHSLATLFERVSLCDRIVLGLRRDSRIAISCTDPAVPRDKRNLCWQAGRLLQQETGVKKGAQIKIIKRIPVGAGLGGGSSNAAAALLGLNRLWDLKLSREKLLALAARLGSDAPFFVYGRAFALGRGRGERIFPLPGLRRVKLWHILAVPKIHVSTPAIYRRWDRLRAQEAGLTTALRNVKIITSALRRKDYPRLRGLFYNSLQQITFKLYPEAGRACRRLNDCGVEAAMMSGSGSAVFGIASSRREAARIKRMLEKEERHWRVFAVATR
jgi:4-diphosphocytidyl-2-C-methyl-D-erythritol kinase